MELQSLKLTLVQHILNTDQPEVLQEMLRMLTRDTPDFEEGLSEATEEELELARKQIAQGETSDWQDIYQRLKEQVS